MKKYFLHLLIFLLTLGVGLYLGTKFFGEKKLRENTEKYISKLNLKDKVEIEDYEYDPLTGVGVLKNIKFKNFQEKDFYLKKINQIVIKKYKLSKDFIPVEIDAQIKGIEAVDKRDEQVKLDVAISYKYDPEKEEFLIKNLEINSEDFLFKSSFKLKNFSKILYEKLQFPGKNSKIDSFLMLSKLLQIKPEFLYVEYKDKGLLDKLVKKEALIEGKSEKEVRKQLLTEIENSFKKSNSKYERELLIGLKSILQGKKGRFKFRIKSKKNLTIQDLIAMYFSYNTINSEPYQIIDAIGNYFEIDLKFIEEKAHAGQ